jgi:hypothetical protein
MAEDFDSLVLGSNFRWVGSTLNPRQQTKRPKDSLDLIKWVLTLRFVGLTASSIGKGLGFRV